MCPLRRPAMPDTWNVCVPKSTESLILSVTISALDVKSKATVPEPTPPEPLPTVAARGETARLSIVGEAGTTGVVEFDDEPPPPQAAKTNAANTINLRICPPWLLFPRYRSEPHQNLTTFPNNSKSISGLITQSL